MFTDERRHKVWNELGQCELNCFKDILSMEVFVEAARRAGVRIVRSPLSIVNLAWLAIAGAIHWSLDWGGVLAKVLELVNEAEGFPATLQPEPGKRGKKAKASGSKHDPRGTDGVSVSEEAFTQARQKVPMKFWMALLMVLGERFEKKRRDMVRWKGFRVLAMDGTDISLPAFEKLKEHFGLPRGGAGDGHSPKARMVMLQLPRTRMPCAYELGPWNVSEIAMAQRLLMHLWSMDLVLLDRGFWSYWLMAAISRQGAFFGIRVKAGSHNFKTIRRLGANDRVVRWTPSPKSLAKWRRAGHEVPPTMDLRMIEYQIPGFRPTAIATNVLDPEVISREDWTRLTTDCDSDGRLLPGLYHWRWEIETTFKELKKTQQWNREHWLRSRTPRGIEYEIAGHVLFYWLTRWLIADTAHDTGQDPRRLSFVNALRVVDDAIPVFSRATPQRLTRILIPNLKRKIAKFVVPFRPGRHYERPGDTQPKYKGRNYYQKPAKLPSRKT